MNKPYSVINIIRVKYNERKNIHGWIIFNMAETAGFGVIKKRMKKQKISKQCKRPMKEILQEGKKIYIALKYISKCKK